MSFRFVQNPWVTGVATSSGATVQTVATLATVALTNSIVYVEATLIFRNTTTGVGGTKKIARTFQNVAGTLTAVDAAILTIVAGLLPAGVLGVAFDLVVSGTNILLQYTGVAATNLEVLGDIKAYVN